MARPDNTATEILFDLREVHDEIKPTMGTMARAAYDHFLAKNRKPAKG